MSYTAAIQNLSALIPELFSAPGQGRRKFSLAEIGILAEALGNPQGHFPSVLIAGTNGKGSTASTLASILHESGLRVGLFTSPHLDRVNERIRLNGEMISDDDFGRLYFRVHDVAQELVLEEKLAHLPSYFELLTALGFLYFAESKVDIAVLEVGMGGRLDATNIVDPALSVITDISLDHQEWLGSTIDLIAREKAGILRCDGILVTLPQHPEANQALGEIAAELRVRGVSAVDYLPQSRLPDPAAPYRVEVMGESVLVDSPLKGVHQHRNIALAIAAAVELAERQGFPVTAVAVERGIHNTRWPGRLERMRLEDGTEIVLDVAHNPAGAWALRAALNASDGAEEARHGQCLIFACLRDKPLEEMARILFPIFDHIVLAPIHSPRATPVAELAAAATALSIANSTTGSVSEAIELARELHSTRIVISGSVYLVGEARALIVKSVGEDAGDAK